MPQANGRSVTRPQTRRFAWPLAAAWTLAVIGSLSLTLLLRQREILEVARTQAGVAVDKDVLFRRWNAMHDSVYVPLTEETPANPYLEVLEREITTPSGVVLTKMNPAYMTRQLHELGAEHTGVQGHITSLKPIRPANEPDPWERLALEAFETGETEVSSIETMMDSPHLRLMRPLIAEEVCLDCHAQQGYKVGDVRGGISASVPMAPLWAIARPQMLVLALGHAVLWVLGLSGLGVSAWRGRKRLRERSRAEETLRASEERYRDLVDSSSDIVWRVDSEGVLTFVSPAVKAISGFEPEELMGMPLDGFLGEESANKARELLGKRLRGDFGGEAIVFELTYRRKDGTDYIGENRSTPLLDPNGVVVGVQGITRDITERKRVEEALRESEERFRQFAENIHEAFWIFDPSSADLSYVNPAFETIWGRSRKELYANSAVFLDAVHPDHRDEIAKAFQKQLQGQYTDMEYRIVRPDGTSRWVRDRTFPIRDESGDIRLFAGIAEDITERKEADEERRNLEAQVQHAQKLESLGVLAGGIAHDFNNLLMTVLGNADLALQDLSPVSPVRPMIEEIEKGARHGADLATQMLAYSGKGAFVKEAVDLGEVVKEMAHLLEASISKKATLTYNLDENLLPIEADATQLRQVIMNLIINASEALGGESGFITISTGTVECGQDDFDRKYLVDELPAGTYVYLKLTDTGQGMDDATLDKLFDPFFTTKFTGRGLGLAAVLGIIRGHGGHISIDSKPGVGTTFRILLPPTAKAVSAKQEIQRAPGAWRGSGTVLLVDDEETVRTVTALMLERFGFSILTASDGHAAIDLFRQNLNEIACVILDLSMPIMGGEETFQKLQGLDNGVPVILSSGYSERELASRFSGTGMAGFIQKPFTSAELMAKIRSILESSTPSSP